MGQHLHLYASRNVTVAEVSKWCHARAHELIEVPSEADQPIVSKVQQEMDRLQRNTPDHLEHWSNWCGPVIWDFLVWQPYTCDDALVGRAVRVASVAMIVHEGVKKMYPGMDLTADDVIVFLRAHLGYTVWGDNDGI